MGQSTSKQLPKRGANQDLNIETQFKIEGLVITVTGGKRSDIKVIQEGTTTYLRVGKGAKVTVKDGDSIIFEETVLDEEAKFAWCHINKKPILAITE